MTGRMKSAAAVELGRKGGLARAKKQTKAQRKAQAALASRARWAKRDRQERRRA